MFRWQSAAVSCDSDALSAWDRLYLRCATTPLLHPDLLRTALRFFGNDSTRLYTCSHAGEVIAAAVLESIDVFRVRTFQPSQAPIGFWLQHPDANTDALLEALHRALKPGVVLVSITKQDPYLLTPPTRSKRLSPSDYIDTARITIDTPWEAYWKSRGANLRHNLKRAKAKLAGTGKSFSMRTVIEPSEMSAAVRTYGEIESGSWKASEGTAVSGANDQGRFYTAVLEKFAQRGRARCYQLLIDGQVAATDLCVRGDDEIVVLKTTFDDRYREYSPAFLMRKAAFENLFLESWCKRIEFYGRVMDWHLRWTDEVRRMYHISYFRYSAVLRLRESMNQLRLRRSPGVESAAAASTAASETSRNKTDRVDADATSTA